MVRSWSFWRSSQARLGVGMRARSRPGRLPLPAFPSVERLEPRFALSITALALGDNLEPNNSLEAAEDLGPVFGKREIDNLSIHSSADEDWIKFTLPVTGTVNDYVEIQFVHLDGDLDALLYDATRQPIDASTGVFNTERLRLAGRAAGEYWIKIYGKNGAQNDAYRLVVRTHAYPDDRFEPNNSLDNAFRLGAMYGPRDIRDLAIPSPDDSDFFKFYLPFGGAADTHVDVLFSHVDGDLDVRLYDSLRRQIRVSEGTDDNERLSFDGLPAGEYYLEVYSYSEINAYDLAFVSPAPSGPDFGLTINGDPLFTNKPRPGVTGTIESLSAAVSISVGGETYTIANPGTGDWALVGESLVADLPEGEYPVFAWATDANNGIAWDQATLIVDLTPPGATFGRIQSPRPLPAGVLQLSFTEPVTGITTDRLRLLRDDEPVGLDGLVIEGAGSEYVLRGLDTLTSQLGSYSLTLLGDETSVVDRVGNALEDDVTIEWQRVPGLPENAAWAFILDNAVISEIAVSTAGDTYVVGSFAGTVDFDPSPATEFSVSSDDGESLGFLASYDPSGGFIQVTLADYKILHVSAVGNQVATAGAVMEAGIQAGRVEVYEVSEDRTLQVRRQIRLPVEVVPGTDVAATRGVFPSELLLADNGQVFLSGTIHSASMELMGPGEAAVAVSVLPNQADGFVAAFSSSGEALWASLLEAIDWYESPVFPNSLAYDSGAGIVAFGATMTRQFGLLPESSERADRAAMAVGLDASSGTYRWDAPVIAGAVVAVDRVAMLAAGGGIYAAAHAFVADSSTAGPSAQSGRVESAVVAVASDSGEVLAGPNLREALAATGEVYVSGLTVRSDGGVLLGVTEVTSAVDQPKQEISLLLFDRQSVESLGEPQVWSTEVAGRTSQVEGANARFVLATAAPTPDAPLIWSIADPFVSSQDVIIDVPSGETLILSNPVDVAGAIVKRGGGTLVLDVANTHSGGLIVESGIVIIRHSQAINGGPLVIWDEAVVIFDSDAPGMTEPSIVVASLEIAERGELDIELTALEVAEGAASLRQNVQPAGGGPYGIISSPATDSGGTRTLVYLVNENGSAKVTFAAPGDADLNGKVDVFDLVAINTSSRFGRGTQATWNQGDFNYDGVANVFDLVKVNAGGAYGIGDYRPTRLAQPAASSAPSLTADAEPSGANADNALAMAFAWLAEEERRAVAPKPLKPVTPLPAEIR
jgi:autotransporter-associated beta strand protein